MPHETETAWMAESDAAESASEKTSEEVIETSKN